MVLDHVVHFVSNPRNAAEELNKLGVHVVEGGRHTEWGTMNSLSYFGLSYLEFLGIEDERIAGRAGSNDLVRQAYADLAKGEGIGRIAIRTDRIEETASRLKEKGYKVAGPFPGSRTRLDGITLKWSLLFIESKGRPTSLPLPFFIQWDQTDEERESDLIKQKALAPHPAGDLTIASVAFAVQNLAGTVHEWETIFGLVADRTYEDPALKANCTEVKLQGISLIFSSPNGEGTVSRVLDTRGERPFLLTFSGAKEEREIHLHGSLYRFSR
jgi:hypothetical protein